MLILISFWFLVFIIKNKFISVTNTIFAIGRAVWKDPKWNSDPKKMLGPKPADLNEREFSEAQLKAGESIIGLQAGQNKGKQIDNIIYNVFELLGNGFFYFLCKMFFWHFVNGVENWFAIKGQFSKKNPIFFRNAIK